MPITQRQLADHLDLHQATVSRCFMSPERVNGETLSRVLRAADQLGYRRHTAASAMRRSRVGAVGLLLGSSGNENFLPLGLLKNLERQARKHQQRLIISHVLDEKLEDRDYVPGILRELAVDSLIVDYIANSPDRLAEMLDRYRVPAVWLNSKRPHNAVYVDDKDAGRKAGTLFAEMGHKRVAYLKCGRGQVKHRAHYSSEDRVSGIAGVAESRGMTYESLCVDGSIDDPQVLRYFAQRLRSDSRPTAILADCQASAIMVYGAALEAGLRIPSDLSLVAIGPSKLRLPGLAVDTLVLPQEPMAVAVIEEAHALLDSSDSKRASRAIPYGPLLAQGSTTHA